MKSKEFLDDEITKREMGAKLRNFREKLGIAIKAKLKQDPFARMFGVTNGSIQSAYENGRTPIPGVLYYRIWKTGNSVDGIFAEQAITDAGRESAQRLYEQIMVEAQVEQLDTTSLQRAEKEAVSYDSKGIGRAINAPTGNGTNGNSKASKHAPRSRSAKSHEKRKS